MSDLDTRELEREAITSGFGKEELGRLKASWARSLTFQVCDRCQAHVPELAWARHGYTHDYQEELERDREAAARGHEPPAPSPHSTRVPSFTPVGARPSKTPLWHRVTLPAGATRFRFFMDPEGESNLGRRGDLGPNRHFYLYGMSLLPDQGGSYPDLLRIYLSGEARLVLGSSNLVESPARLLGSPFRAPADEFMADPAGPALETLTPARDVRISGRPINISAMEAFMWDLCWSAPIREPAGLMAVFHGLQLRGITA